MAFILAAKSSVAASRAFRAARPQGRPFSVSRVPLRGLSLITLATADAETVEKVRTIIAEQLGKKVDEVAAEAKFVDLGADSLDTVEIMMAFEDNWDLTLDEEGAEKITTVQEAADLIAAQVASGTNKGHKEHKHAEGHKEKAKDPK